MAKVNYQKLPPKFKAKWVAALRSGEYKKTTGTLFSDKKNGFCCLGVAGRLCEIGLKKLKGENDLTESKFNKNKKIPALLKGESNKDGINPQDRLIAMNDKEYKSFDDIAGWIERNL